MIEVRFHGRGGQGAVMASRILATAFVKTGRYGASFPMFGFERRGAPVTAFGRFDDKPIREKTQIYNPHVLVVLDSSQRVSPRVFDGLAANGTMVLNHGGALDLSHENLSKAGIIDASAIAQEEIGIPLPNTCILGAFARVTGLVDLDSLVESLGDYFQGKKRRANALCVERGFSEVAIHTV